VADYADWPWSSYHRYFIDKPKMARIKPECMGDDNRCYGE